MLANSSPTTHERPCAPAQANAVRDGARRYPARRRRVGRISPARGAVGALCGLSGAPSGFGRTLREHTRPRRQHDKIDASLAMDSRPLEFEVMHRLQAAGVLAAAVLKATKSANEQLAARDFFDPSKSPTWAICQRYFLEVRRTGLRASHARAKAREHRGGAQGIGLDAAEISGSRRGRHLGVQRCCRSTQSAGCRYRSSATWKWVRPAHRRTALGRCTIE